MDKLAPFDDPRIQQKQKITANASFNAFNAVATRLLSDLARIYPTDSTIRLLATELCKLAANKSRYKTGALVFFREIRKPSQRVDGSACFYMDLLAAHADYAFTVDPIPVTVLQTAGLSEKWKEMSPELKQGIWEFVDRLIHLSAQAVICSSTATAEMNSLSRAIVGATVAGHGDTPQALMDDSAVKIAADAFVDSIK